MQHSIMTFLIPPLSEERFNLYEVLHPGRSSLATPTSEVLSRPMFDQDLVDRHLAPAFRLRVVPSVPHVLRVTEAHQCWGGKTRSRGDLTALFQSVRRCSSPNQQQYTSSSGGRNCEGYMIVPTNDNRAPGRCSVVAQAVKFPDQLQEIISRCI